MIEVILVVAILLGVFALGCSIGGGRKLQLMTSGRNIIGVQSVRAI